MQLVATQAGCSRAKAAQALRRHDYDLVNAIMVGTTARTHSLAGMKNRSTD